MASIPEFTNIDERMLLKKIIVKIKLTHKREIRLKLLISGWLIKLACKIGGFTIKIESNVQEK